MCPRPADDHTRPPGRSPWGDLRVGWDFPAGTPAEPPAPGFGRSSVVYDYEIVHIPSERLVASAKTVQVWFDSDANKSVAISEALKRQLTQPGSADPSTP